MAVSDLYMTLTGASDLKSVVFRDGYNQASSYAQVTCLSHSLSLNDTVDLDFGYASDHATFINGGRIKKIEQSRPENNYVLHVYDKLTDAVDFFIAPDDPDAPLTASNITAEDLVNVLLALASLPAASSDATGFTYGVVNPVPIKLTGVWEYIDNICRICGFNCYVDSSGNIQFRDRKPYLVGGDTSSHTFTTGDTGDILSLLATKSDEKIRNKVVVYGAPTENGQITAQASASSPYIPAGFYKTMVVAHELIDSQHDAQRTADVNLAMFNRLTQNATLRALGQTAVKCRSIISCNESFVLPGDTDPWFVYSSEHTLDTGGYVMKATLVR